MDLLVDGDVVKLLALGHQLHGAGEPGPGHLGLGGVSGEELVTAQLLICSKLDGVGPVDNRPSTDKLHHFVRKKKRKKM